jgi:hypothetical protein
MGGEMSRSSRALLFASLVSAIATLIAVCALAVLVLA